MTPGDLGKLLALQSGAFITQHQHSRFDTTKQADCEVCGVPATQRHWFDCPKLATLRLEHPVTLVDDMPTCQLHHLLVPRSEFYSDFKRYFLSLEDHCQIFMSEPGCGVQHLFSDGSFFFQTPKITSCAAWAVVNASTGHYTGFGTLPGLAQSISRAELTGALAAAHWCLHFNVCVCLWSDSANTVRGINAILEGRWMRADSATEDADLWIQLRNTLDQIPSGFFKAVWIPAHLHGALCDPGYEEWIATWNGVADSGAIQANQHRSAWFLHHSKLLQSRHQAKLAELRQLRDFYFQVADQTFEDDGPDDSALIEPAEDLLNLTETLAIDWKVQLHTIQADLKYPVQFAFSLFEAVCLLEDTPQLTFSVSFIELTLWFLTDVQLPVPIWDPVGNVWVLRDYFGMLLRPTFASIVSCVRVTFQQCLLQFGFGSFLRKAITRQDAGISMPVDGLQLSTSFDYASRLGTLAREYGGSHGIRKTSDLAKPL